MLSPTKDSYFPLAIQISAEAWENYGLPQELLRDSSGLYPLRRLADHLQRRRPDGALSAGQLNLLALLNTTFRFVVVRYLQLRRCTLELEGFETGGRKIELPALRPVLENFVRLFPPAATRRGTARENDFLQGTDGGPNRERTAVELFLLAVQTSNPAAGPFIDLFDDLELNRSCRYREVLARMDDHLQEDSVPGVFGGSLLKLLQEPINASPRSLSGQLEYVQRNWGSILPPELLRGILTAFDVVREEQQMRGGGPGPIPVPRFGRTDLFYEEPERFSPDADWMSNVVLIAKTIYVWLDQLSKKYGRSIVRLDQIPDEELDNLARWGFNSLWLIGIWERSPASQKIKQIMGNPEAVSSAYSLYDYVVAGDLGGEAALANLEDRCRHRGIRLGCDVVPNHTGIYSKWIKEHPDWYVQVDRPPYPSYRYTGPNLSFDSDIVLQVEDGYWNHSDAGVVFRYLNNHTGQERFIYHGNDGTHLPWNDTAQLNFLIPEVREAMIQTILYVARRFKVIRFDAAMTLAKKHYQRLWFPQPGGGAGVPSRAEHAMSREDFERAFPVEFWREVVDRVAAEVPDTLLLAEAFWLMEGYFVRTLGMHRVYNSAFMNMLKTEDNGKYRSVLKNILEFNPEILKRFVNFMNNPDEATAVAQFGTGDKYFGVAVLLVTMPGLPMFGHGQVEGLREKYGMEYRRAYWDEPVDEAMVHHHTQQIFPLMRRRWLFSGSQHFVLYDFFSDGHVNEDVFAYSNRFGHEKALVLYHNRHGETSGWIRTSVAKMAREGGQERTIQTTVGEALDVRSEARHFYRFRDFRTGLEYLRRGGDLSEQGLFFHLGPYEYHVFLDFRELYDEDGLWERICAELNGRPVPDLDLEWRKRRLSPLLESLERAADPDSLQCLEKLLGVKAPLRQEPSVAALRRETEAFLGLLGQSTGAEEDPEVIGDRILGDLEAVKRLSTLSSRRKGEQEALSMLRRALPVKGTEGDRKPQFFRILMPWLLVRRSGELTGAKGAPSRGAQWMEEYLLSIALQQVLRKGVPPFALPEWESAGEVLLIQILVRHQGWGGLEKKMQEKLAALLDDPQVQTFLGCNLFGGVRWFNKERLETLVYWLFFTAAVDLAAGKEEPLPARLAELNGFLRNLLGSAEKSGYRWDRFVESAKGREAPLSL